MTDLIDEDDPAFAVPGKQAMAVAKALAEKWWHEGKLSYNWNPKTDVEFLATVIQNNEVPNEPLNRPDEGESELK